MRATAALQTEPSSQNAGWLEIAAIADATNAPTRPHRVSELFIQYKFIFATVIGRRAGQVAGRSILFYAAATSRSTVDIY